MNTLQTAFVHLGVYVPHAGALGHHGVAQRSVRVFVHFEHDGSIIFDPEEIDPCKTPRSGLIEFDDVFARKINMKSIEKERNIFLAAFASRFALVHSSYVFPQIFPSASSVGAVLALYVFIAVDEFMPVQYFALLALETALFAHVFCAGVQLAMGVHVAKRFKRNAANPAKKSFFLAVRQ